jgi:UPF0176 protein
MEIHVTTFYRFTPFSPKRVSGFKTGLEAVAKASGLRGLCLVGAEGVNATISGSAPAIDAAKKEILAQLTDLEFKDSVCDKHPFNFFKVKIKEEIVTIGRPGMVPSQPKSNHLSPAEWRTASADPETVLLDTRNRYEVEIGKFREAVDLQIDEFNEFGERVRAAGLPLDKKILMYCTGGIRCEKAILEMRSQGYENVYQLDGGILNYLKEYPNGDFDGECFVFDYRVAVDRNLRATKTYKLCPHCGQPAKDLVKCRQCGREEYVCPNCVPACSRNCAHHLEIGSASSGRHEQEFAKRHR